METDEYQGYTNEAPQEDFEPTPEPHGADHPEDFTFDDWALI